MRAPHPTLLSDLHHVKDIVDDGVDFASNGHIAERYHHIPEGGIPGLTLGKQVAKLRKRDRYGQVWTNNR